MKKHALLIALLLSLYFNNSRAINFVSNLTPASPSALDLKIEKTNTTSRYCEDGTIKATLINYSLDSNPTFTLYDSSNVQVAIWNLNIDSNASHTFTNLPVGLYSLTATAGNQSKTKSKRILRGACNFSFNDVTIDSISKGYSGPGCEYSIEVDLHYNGAACDSINFLAHHIIPWSGEDVISVFNKSGNTFSASGFYELVSDGITIIGNNGKCIDSIYFHPNPLPCAVNQTIYTSNVSCGGTIGAAFSSNFCNPAFQNIYIAGVSNNLNFSNSGFTSWGIPNGTYNVSAFDGGCSGPTELVTISNAIWDAPTDINYNQIGSLPDVKITWKNYCTYYYTPQYQLQIKQQNATNWTSYWVADQWYKRVKNLTFDSVYDYRIRVVPFPNINGEWSAIQSFCIGPNCAARSSSGIERMDSEMDFKVSPNPASNLIKLQFDSENTTGGIINITDQTGRIVYSKNEVTLSIDFTIDVAAFPAGLYIVNIISGNEIRTARFIKMN